ncbi:hypothetical protein ACFPKY_12925 [Nocardioides caricicola]|uniref:WD40 repeat domain-containing protein n=1 Tax=Nocardioides caricicola TaxID=634770 RepID=A0ABW0N4X5_9ACTN
MVNDLKDLMRQNVAAPPPDHLDLDSLVDAGRRRVRTRRVRTGVGAVAAVGVIAVGGSLLPSGTPPEQAAARPRPEAPTITLADATAAVEGRDYRQLASQTNDDLDNDNGQYLDGVTDDGQILFRDGPRAEQWRPRFALMDPATGDKDWLPALEGVGQDQTWPAELSADRLVLLSLRNGLAGELRAHVFDRAAGEWSTLTWPGLPQVDFPRAIAGPDDRLYVRVVATQGQPPEGGWPTGPDGEADDADFEGDTYHLWSVSLTDTADVRDEGLVVGDVAFTDTAMVWTDRTGDAGMMHVRDFATGEESSFDPEVDDRCNLLSFGASGDRIVMGEYCGTYASGRDDRLQIVSTDGEQVVTLQDDGISGWLPPGSDVVNIDLMGAPGDDRTGTYVYDLESGRFLRISDAMSSWGLGGATGQPGQFTWHTPVNQGKGSTQYVGELLD